MTPSLMKLLQSVDTPTVCNAIEVAQGKRGFNDFTRGTMLCSAPDEGAIVGYARTAKIAAVHAPTEPADVIKARRMSYYKHMAEGPRPAVTVIEDLDFPDCIGAFWGEINTTIHKGFGISGTLTNGVMRDLGDVPEGYPVIAGSIGPSHGFVHVKEIGTAVEIFGMTVRDGDLVHADQHGAIVVPDDVIPALEAAITKLLDTESIILDVAREEGFDFASFEKAWGKFEQART
ncbi:Regulator of RNase E activity RraA [Epibacterium ulvae]|uniref:Regulator of RNase E activity RraA n=1 Tax=Epibacterium ulvae TaxID=1156985 RepID=A0A1G5QJW3_9RHOB|nr:RraA family protein [Epibacterium ulvae]SCZ61898.1 Regulator of RNase E activity RraA [Epibacterium ulvae]